MSDYLDRARELDSGSQADDVLDLPDHLRDALWRLESAGIEASQSGGLVACGMGGSGVGGALARAALVDRTQKPMMVVRGYGPPIWTLEDYAVLCSSYSGSTEETLACFAAAEAVGARRIVATTGGPLAEQARAAGVPVVGIPSGLQPRAAVGYLFTIAADAAAVVGVAQAIHTEIDAAAAWLEQSQDRLIARAGEIAAEVEGSIPVMYGSDLTGPVSYRWKTQINENAKQHAFQAELPEAAHNEVVGWDGSSGSARFSAIFLQDSDQHPREHERVEKTAEVIASGAQAVLRIDTEGETRTARLLWAVMLGDLVSLALAASNGVDPTPIAPIERLKDALGRPD